MKKVEFVRPKADNAAELGRVLYEAFKRIHDRHAFPRDFPTIESANLVMGMMLSRPDFHGVAARSGEKLVGSNFLSTMDAVGGVGPISVDPEFEGRGIGRALMMQVLEMARQHGVEQVRLLQDSFNACSLSLYASLGFQVRESVGLVEARPAECADPSIRAVAEADLPVIEELSRRHFHFSRRNEVAAATALEIMALLRERDGRVTGYLIPGFLGHGAAESVEDALALIGEAARRVPPKQAMFFCPLSQGDFYRASLQAGYRLRKVMTYMTIGPFERPAAVWMPSVLY